MSIASCRRRRPTARIIFKTIVKTLKLNLFMITTSRSHANLSFYEDFCSCEIIAVANCILTLPHIYLHNKKLNNYMFFFSQANPA